MIILLFCSLFCKINAEETLLIDDNEVVISVPKLKYKHCFQEIMWLYQINSNVKRHCINYDKELIFININSRNKEYLFVTINRVDSLSLIHAPYGFIRNDKALFIIIGDKASEYFSRSDDREQLKLPLIHIEPRNCSFQLTWIYKIEDRNLKLVSTSKL